MLLLPPFTRSFKEDREMKIDDIPESIERECSDFRITTLMPMYLFGINSDKNISRLFVSIRRFLINEN